jgi:outer membrane protein assembly factor BamB
MPKFLLGSIFIFFPTLCWIPQNLFADYWADFHGTPLITGIDSGSRFNSSATITPPFFLMWSHYDWVPANSIQESSPAVADGIVYVGSQSNGPTYSGALYAWYSSTGALVPGFPIITSDRIESSPAVANGKVYVGCMNGQMYAFNATNGVPVPGFPVTTGGYIRSSPSVYNGIVYLGSNDGMLHAWDASTGAVIPGFPVGAGGDTSNSPTIANGIVYLSSWTSTSGMVHAWNAANGAIISGFPVTTAACAGCFSESSPVVAGGIVYAGAADGKLYAWNAANGTPVSGFPVLTGGPISSSPAVANGKIYVGSGDSKLYALDATNGSVVPGFPVGTGGPIYSSPAVANSVVYVGSSDGALYAWDANDGNLLWKYMSFPVNWFNEGFDSCSPAIAENKLFVTSDGADGIYVFGMPTSTPTATCSPTASITPTSSPTSSISPTSSASSTISITPSQTTTFTVTVTATSSPQPFCVHSVGTNPSPADTNGTYIVYDVCNDSRVQIQIYTISGEKVRELSTFDANAGSNEEFWDCRNQSGQIVSNAVYIYRILATNKMTNISRAVFGKCAVLR